MNHAFLERNDWLSAVVPVNPSGSDVTGDRVNLKGYHRFVFKMARDAGSGHPIINLHQADAVTAGNTKVWSGIRAGWYRSSATTLAGTAPAWTKVDINAALWDLTSIDLDDHESEILIEAETQTMDAENGYHYGFVVVENITGIASFDYMLLDARYGGPDLLNPRV